MDRVLLAQPFLLPPLPPAASATSGATTAQRYLGPLGNAISGFGGPQSPSGDLPDHPDEDPRHAEAEHDRHDELTHRHGSPHLLHGGDATIGARAYRHKRPACSVGLAFAEPLLQHGSDLPLFIQ